MSLNKFPVVLANDDGIRPAGSKNQCFYCHSIIGESHKRDCATIKKIVDIEFKVLIPVEVPHSWEETDIDFRYNESTWCADNLVHLMQDVVSRNERLNSGCLCARVSAEYIRTIDDTPIQKTHPHMGDGQKEEKET